MFELTQEKIDLNVHISAIAAGVSIFCCLSILSLTVWVYSVRSARPCLDRLSFRLLVWTLSVELIYDINYIASVLGSRQDALCALGIYVMIATLGIVNYLCTCIAVNLCITIVFGLNPIMLRLERWYIGASFFVGLFVPIVPAALGHFGWDPVLQVCWIRTAGDGGRLRNFVLDLYLWQLLSCFIASTAVIATIWTLFRQGRATSKALYEGNSMNLDMSGNSLEHDEHDHEKAHGHGPRGMISRALGRRRMSREKERQFGHHLEDRFIRIALRISTYPVALIIVNGLIAIGDLYVTHAGGVKSVAAYGLYCVYYFFYGARGMVFASLALFVDPALRKGIAVAWHARFPARAERKARKEAAKQLNGNAGNGNGNVPKEPWGSSGPYVGVTPHASAANPLDPLDPLDPIDSTMYPPAPTTSMAHNGTMPGDADENGLERQNSANSMDMLQALFASEPPDHHAHHGSHWEWHSGAHGELGGVETARDRRLFRRAHSAPHIHHHIPHLPRFLRRHAHRKAAEQAAATGEDPEMGMGMDMGLDLHGLADIKETETFGGRPSSSEFTEAFAGVHMGGLPAGMEDGADDVVHPDVLDAVAELQEHERRQANIAQGSLASRGSVSRTPGRTPLTPVSPVGTPVSPLGGPVSPIGGPISPGAPIPPIGVPLSPAISRATDASTAGAGRQRRPSFRFISSRRSISSNANDDDYNAAAAASAAAAAQAAFAVRRPSMAMSANSGRSRPATPAASPAPSYGRSGKPLPPVCSSRASYGSGTGYGPYGSYGAHAGVANIVSPARAAGVAGLRRGGGSFASGSGARSPRSPLAVQLAEERRTRRKVAMEIAERLYEEMEAQL